MSPSSAVIGRYEILSKIGEGSLSICYKAHDPKTGRELAIKLLKDNAALEEFIRESRMIGKLSHHNIATIYDVGEHQGHAFIAMELLQGEALDLVMRRQHRMRWSLVVDLAKQLASALE